MKEITRIRNEMQNTHQYPDSSTLRPSSSDEESCIFSSEGGEVVVEEEGRHPTAGAAYGASGSSFWPSPPGRCGAAWTSTPPGCGNGGGSHPPGTVPPGSRCSGTVCLGGARSCGTHGTAVGDQLRRPPLRGSQAAGVLLGLPLAWREWQQGHQQGHQLGRQQDRQQGQQQDHEEEVVVAEAYQGRQQPPHPTRTSAEREG